MKSCQRSSSVTSLICSYHQGSYLGRSQHYQAITCEILKLLYASKNRKLNKVFVQESRKQPFLFLSKIFFVDSGAVYHLTKHGFNLCSQLDTNYCIRATEILFYTVTCPLMVAQYGHSSALLMLTRNNQLVQFFITNKKMFVGNIFNLGERGRSFTTLEWNESAYSIVLKTSIKRLDKMNVFKEFVIYSVPELILLEHLQIMQVALPPKTRDVDLSSNVLFVHINSGIKLYDLLAVINLNSAHRHKPGEPLQITKFSPALYSLTCMFAEAAFGKVPWHVIYAPPNSQELVVQQLNDKSSITKIHDNGLMREDSSFFHPDESGRIISINHRRFKIFKLRDNVLHEEFSLLPSVSPIRHNQYVRRTHHAGRLSTNELVNLFLPRKVFCMDYEDELCILVLVTAEPVLGCEDEDLSGFIHLYDNKTYELIRKVSLDLELCWCEEDTVRISMDRDLILFSIVRSRRSNKIDSIVFSLSEIISE